MSKKINVNPDHYKTKGRERQGEDVIVAREKQELTQALAAGGRGRASRKGPLGKKSKKK